MKDMGKHAMKNVLLNYSPFCKNDCEKLSVYQMSLLKSFWLKSPPEQINF